MYNHDWGYSGYGAVGDMGGQMGWLLPLFLLAAPLILIFALWTLFWKGLGLWHAAQRGQYWWFVILLLVNTLGILEIIYLFAVAKLHFHDLFSSHSHNHDHSHHNHSH